MLFWKWTSDNWDWERAKAVEDFGEDVEPEVEADYHRFNLPEGAHWREVITKTDNLGSRVAKALGRIEQSNPESLAGIFGDSGLEALRVLKRRLSDVVYAALRADLIATSESRAA